jgi:hypothetical protein
MEGREVVLKVDKRGGSQHAPKLVTHSERDLKKKHIKTCSKTASKARSGDKVRSSMTQASTDEKKAKSEDSSLSNEITKKLACIMKLETDKRKRTKVEKDESPPPWFKKYMQKVHL